MMTGTHGDIEIGEETDADGELEIQIGWEYGYIEKKEAADIMRHLATVFDINYEDL
jgi:hypothetical protein